MFKNIRKKTAVNLITGSLGAGKTTLLRNFIEHKPHNEKWVVLVNEFGAIGIDGPILSSQNNISVSQIPGGCICCTAQSELKEAIEQLLEQYTPDRLFIEPTGLGEPDTLVDLLQSQFFQQRFEIQTVFAVLDAATTKMTDFEQYTIMQNLLNMADAVIFNKSSLATEEQLSALENYAAGLYPPKSAVIATNHCAIDVRLLNLNHSNKQTNITKELVQISNQEHVSMPDLSTSHHIEHLKNSIEPENLKINSKAELPGLVTREIQNQLNTLSVGWIFDDSIEFNWSALFSQFKAFNLLNKDQQPLRAKGVFKVGKPWMLFQWVSNQATREFIAYRRDSRVELLLPQETTFDFAEFETILKNCIKTPS
ncbi:MAG: GTP-binding protein [Pseudomonadota bacterium]|nr:GTP-binding protein [Pseudomonadota bacterium]